MLYLSPYTLIHLNQNDMVRNGVIGGAVVGILVSSSYLYFPDYSQLLGIDLSGYTPSKRSKQWVVLIFSSIYHILTMAFCWLLSNLDYATIPVSFGLSIAIFLYLGGFSKYLRLKIGNLPEKRLGVIGILLILSGFVLALAQPVADILNIRIY